MEVGGQVSSEGGQAVVWLVMVEEVARPEVGLRASHAMAMSLYTSSHTSNMQVVMLLYVLLCERSMSKPS